MANQTAKLPAPPRKAKTPRACACGCGAQTKGGRFAPGHDARLLGLVRRVEVGIMDLAAVEAFGGKSVRAAVEAEIARRTSVAA